MSLLLFDIDGTLVDTGGVGLGALQAGLLDAFSLHERAEEVPTLDLAGATDSSVARELLSAFGIEDTSHHRKRFFDSYVVRLRRALSSNRTSGRVLPGVHDLLSALRDTEHHLTVLTGNTREGAAAKLCHYDIEHFFELDAGAFGDERETRNELGPLALERGKSTFGREFSGSDTIVLGDTPKDIAVARAIGARAFAVATGGFSLDELATHKPCELLEDLSDTHTLLSKLV